MDTNKINKSLISKSKILSFLVIVSLVMTTGTFAYWANYVEETSSNISNSITIGSASSSSFPFEETGILNDNDFYVSVLDFVKRRITEESISYDLRWGEQNTSSSNWGTVLSGDIEVFYEVIITKDGSNLSLSKYNRIYKYLTITASDSNPQKISKDGSINPFDFFIELERPSKSNDRNLMKKVEIEIIFSYRITNSPSADANAENYTDLNNQIQIENKRDNFA